MNSINLSTTCKRMPADVFTPVGIYLRLRDRFRDTILLESTDHHAAENSFSFIGINAIAGIECTDMTRAEFKLPGLPAERVTVKTGEVTNLLQQFMNKFSWAQTKDKQSVYAQGLYGYTSFDAIGFFEKSTPANTTQTNFSIPLIRYRLYQYVIAIDHFRDELFLLENHCEALVSEVNLVESLIRSKDVPEYPFSTKGNEQAAISNDSFIEMVKKGIASCHRGDVFQVVLSRCFMQAFTGDEFNVYRALRTVNPSPYLFYFDYGDYKLMGSSPEAQLVINHGKAILHPIAGTFKRTGDDELDRIATEKLLQDKKENAEHVMLVDLARNDLSRLCDHVEVAAYREVKYYSHVIHLVSEVSGEVRKDASVFDLLAKTFPAGTLSGAPKIRALQLIGEYEPHARGYYGGAIGFIGFDGSCNHAIMIRTMLSMNNTLVYQAGAGIVAASDPATELDEVNNKLGALKRAIEQAPSFSGYAINEKSN